MQNCPQTDSQSVYEHGLSVQYHTRKLIELLSDQNIDHHYKLPDWFTLFNKEIINKLLPISIIDQYTLFHDCGKPFCLVYDEVGKRHFPNHAEVSSQTWLDAGGDPQIGKLIKMDMMIHTMKSVDINSFVILPEAITLLIVGLAEIHANAELFGGIEFTSFKIKWKHISKCGKLICQKLFRRDYVID